MCLIGDTHWPGQSWGVIHGCHTSGFWSGLDIIVEQGGVRGGVKVSCDLLRTMAYYVLSCNFVSLCLTLTQFCETYDIA